MLPLVPPEDGLQTLRDGRIEASWQPVFDDLERVILPGVTHWQSPNFYAYFPCNASGPGILGELLSAGLNVNGMLWATSPAATELEMRVLDWLAQMLDLPRGFHSRSERGGGCIQGTASESTLIALLAARARVRAQIGAAAGKADRPDLVAYASTEAHSSVIKAAMIAGLARSPEDRTHLRPIETDDDFAMRPDVLAAAMREDTAAGRVPFFVCATVGTTSTTAIDPVDRIAAALRAVASRPANDLPWLHVDAAHAGCACICPELRPLLRGVEHADSLCLNPHKWLLTNFDCDCFYTRDRASLLRALSVSPEYLRNAATQSGGVIDYRDWQVPLGRRFRALKLWLVIRHYGVRGLQAYIREHVRLGALFESCVRADDRFEIAAPRPLNLVCFRLRGDGADARNRSLLDAINASGRAYLTHTVLRQRFTLRMAIGSATTREHHVLDAWRLIQDLASRV
jgi:aromatic-L-amino-acid decarboxylase